jgi:hypothetical protein
MNDELPLISNRQLPAFLMRLGGSTSISHEGIGDRANLRGRLPARASRLSDGLERGGEEVAREANEELARG